MIEIQGLQEIETTLQKLQKKTQNLKPHLTKIGNIIRSQAELNLKSSTDTQGNPFADLSPKYKERKLKKKKGLQQTLVDRGALKRIVVKADTNSVEIGTNAKSKGRFPYPKVHQFGSKTKKIPKRAFLPFRGSEDSLQIEAKSLVKIMEYLEGELLEGKQQN